MGLDGISINQIRTQQESNSSELNSSVNFKLPAMNKAVDGLSHGQRVNPNKDKEHENSKGFNANNNKKEADSEENTNEIQEEVIKYDLSKNDKYSLKIDDDTNEILIIEKDSKKILEKIDAGRLSNFVGFLTNPQGCIINRKF